MDDSIDQETRQVIIALQLQDAAALWKGQRGVGDFPPDAEVAARLFEQELRSLETSYADRDLSNRLASQEALAEALTTTAGGSHTEDAQPDTLTGKASEPSQCDKTTEVVCRCEEACLCEEACQCEEVCQCEEPSQPEEPKKECCVACFEETVVAETLTCPCDHVYCYGCMGELFRLAMFDEHSFPPGCCGKAIPLGMCREILSSEQIREYEKKELEYSTGNRTYCYLPDCSAFIPPLLIHGKAGTCEKCECKTCISCKGPSHEDECPDDEATQEQTCYSCSRIVELRLGCNHMTCPCGAQFCYVCGIEWKKCSCDQWNEDRLLDRADPVAGRVRAVESFDAEDVDIL
ncbi:hypothetical protein GGI35DRAFT_470311 [Trichoderma velutinum]